MATMTTRIDMWDVWRQMKHSDMGRTCLPQPKSSWISLACYDHLLLSFRGPRGPRSVWFSGSGLGECVNLHVHQGQTTILSPSKLLSWIITVGCLFGSTLSNAQHLESWVFCGWEPAQALEDSWDLPEAPCRFQAPTAKVL